MDEDYYGQPFHTLEIDGSISPQTAAGLEQRIWAHLLAPMKLIQDLAPDKLGSFAAGEASGTAMPWPLSNSYRFITCSKLERRGSRPRRKDLQG